MVIKADHAKYELGYVFWPIQYPHSLGHPRLDITLSNVPSNLHFDPKEVHLYITPSLDKTQPKSIEHLKISHPWTHRTSYRVAPGMLFIEDRKGKKVEAYSFGGNLQIKSDDATTKCIIESEAPILEIIETNPVVMMLVEEVEIIFAKRRVIWAHDREGFEARLADIHPELLYASCLVELRAKFNSSHISDGTGFYEFIKSIDREMRSRVQEGLWPDKVPSISEIL